MATSRTLRALLLFALATTLAGVLLDGVQCDSTSAGRREAWGTHRHHQHHHHPSPPPPPPSPPPPAAICTSTSCAGTNDFNGKPSPDCCINPGGGLFCTDLTQDDIHCGGCNAKCSPVGGCCSSTCVDFQIDPNNCNGCGIKCKAPTPNCVSNKCSA